MKATFRILVFLAAVSVHAQPVVETILAGTKVVLAASASGEPTPTFEWLKNDAKVAAGSALTFDAIAETDSGVYTLRATNPLGSATSDPYTITVEKPAPPPPPPTGAPVFTLHPASQEGVVGGSLTFTAFAQGNPAPTYQWYQNNVPVPGATAASWTRNPVAITDGNTIVKVSAANEFGSVFSGEATFWARYPPPEPALSAPVFTQMPVNMVVELGRELALTVAATGNPTPTIQWRKDGANLAGATSATYSVISVTSNAVVGEYSATATNSQGTAVSSSAFVTIRETTPAGTPPVIASAPLSLVVAKKANARFEVAATSAVPLKYQWRKGSTNITGATNAALILNNVNPPAAGTYSVHISNQFGSVTTSATLTVVNPQNP